MQKKLMNGERLLIAADYREKKQFLALARHLRGTNVCFKVRGPVLRAYGYGGFIREIHRYGYRGCLDLELSGDADTLKDDGVLLHKFRPDLVTVACRVGTKAIRALKSQLPNTEVIGILPEESPLQCAQLAEEGGIDGFIVPGALIRTFRAKFGHKRSIIASNVRPGWVTDPLREKPTHVWTLEEAFEAGADRVIVGQPILELEQPFREVVWTLGEIDHEIKKRLKNEYERNKLQPRTV